MPLQCNRTRGKPAGAAADWVRPSYEKWRAFCSLFPKVLDMPLLGPNDNRCAVLAPAKNDPRRPNSHAEAAHGCTACRRQELRLACARFAALVRLHSPQHQQFHAHVLMPLARAADATRAHALLPQRKGCSPAASGAL